MHGHVWTETNINPAPPVSRMFFGVKRCRVDAHAHSATHDVSMQVNGAVDADGGVDEDADADADVDEEHACTCTSSITLTSA